MAILHELVIAVFFIYAAECIMYLRRHHIAFAINIFNQPRVFLPGFRLVHILPLGRLYIVPDPVFHLTKKGIYLPATEIYQPCLYNGVSNYTLVLYADIKSIEASEKTLLLNKKFRIVFQTSTAAEHFLAFIRQLIDASPEERALLIESDIMRATDTSLIDKRMKSAQRCLRSINYSSLLFSALLLIVFPAWVLSNGAFHMNTMLFVMVLTANYVLNIVLFCLASKKLHGRIEMVEMIQLVLCPVGFFHSSSLLTAPLLSSYDPVATALLFFKRDKLISFLRKPYNALVVSCSGQIPEDLLHRCHVLVKRYRDIFRQQGISEDDFEPCGPSSSNVSGYCPLCCTEYMGDVSLCADCKVPLKAFKKKYNRATAGKGVHGTG